MDFIVFMLIACFLVVRGMETAKRADLTVTENNDNLEIKLNPMFYKDEEAFTKLRKEILERGHI